MCTLIHPGGEPVGTQVAESHGLASHTALTGGVSLEGFGSANSLLTCLFGSGELGRKKDQGREEGKDRGSFTPRRGWIFAVYHMDP